MNYFTIVKKKNKITILYTIPIYYALSRRKVKFIFSNVYAKNRGLGKPTAIVVNDAFYRLCRDLTLPLLVQIPLEE